jgi:hypothetical protein
VVVEVVAPVHGDAARVTGSGSTEETAMEYHAPEEPASTICGLGTWAWDAGARNNVKDKHEHIANSFAIFIFLFSFG